MNENVNSILGKDRIFAELTLLPVIDSNGKSRKDLSEHARKAIMSVLPQTVQESRDKPPETQTDHQGGQR